MKKYAIVLASGTGQRFGPRCLPKHLTLIKDVPVLAWTLNTILISDVFDRVFVVLRDCDLSVTTEMLDAFIDRDDYQTVIVEDGRPRIDSFIKGLSFIKENIGLDSQDIITLFDANRPFAQISQLKELSIAAEHYGCSCPARGVVNGVAEISGDKIISVPEKSRYVEFVTPEFISYEIVRNSLEKHSNSLACMVEYALAENINPHFVSATPCNTKLTFPEDEAYLEGLVEQHGFAVPLRKTVLA